MLGWSERSCSISDWTALVGLSWTNTVLIRDNPLQLQCCENSFTLYLHSGSDFDTVFAEIFIRHSISFISYFWPKGRNLVAHENHACMLLYMAPSKPCTHAIVCGTFQTMHACYCMWHRPNHAHMLLYVAPSKPCTHAIVCGTVQTMHACYCMWHRPNHARMLLYVAPSKPCMHAIVCDTALGVRKLIVYEKFEKR